MIAFTVYGRPAPQGSKTRTRHGMRDSNTVTLAPWRDAVRSSAVTERLATNRPPCTGPVSVTILFTLNKPAAAPKTRRSWPIAARSGDIDKLTRAVLDAMTDAGVWHDDSQVVTLFAGKVYVGDDGALDTPGALIRAREVTEDQP